MSEVTSLDGALHDDPGELLARIRARAVDLASGVGPGVGAIVAAALPQPLDPVALLPVATGLACDASAASLTDVAAAVVLAALALRIVDDAADGDNPGAVDRAVGIGRAANTALALQAAVLRDMARLDADRQSQGQLAACCLTAFLVVADGQDADMRGQVHSVDAWHAVAARKTVAAFACAAEVGALAAGAMPATLDACRRCGEELGWMVQLLDDLESLATASTASGDSRQGLGLPMLLGLASGDPRMSGLEAASRDAAHADDIRRRLGALGVQQQLLERALDHRDAALAALREAPSAAGAALLGLWLDWLWRDAMRLTDPPG